MRFKNTLFVLLGVLLLVFIGGIDLYSQNDSNHSFGTTPEISHRILLTDSLVSELSTKAKKVIGRPYTPIPSHYTHADTAFSASLFAPLAFDLSNISHTKNTRKLLKAETEIRNPFLMETIGERITATEIKRLSNNKVAQAACFYEIASNAREHILTNSPRLVRRSSDQFPERVDLTLIDVQYGGELAQITAPIIPVQPATELSKTIDRKYWTHGFRGNLHLSQSSVSKNWHKGGHNSLNFNGRAYYNITYKKDKINWVNELEYKIGLFANDVDYSKKEALGIKISEDLFRINSNYGVEAFKNWFYTIEAQLRSQLMTNEDGEGVLVTRIFAPIHLAAGLGMKYQLDLKNINGDPFHKLKFSVNIAPISATLVYTYTDDIDKGRIGLMDNERHKLRIGSTIHANLNWDFNDRLNWRSRLYYNTSYQHVEAEFENALSFAFNRFFSTRLALDLRYDDSVILDEPTTFKNLIQYNQLLSIGFEYKF